MIRFAASSLLLCLCCLLSPRAIAQSSPTVVQLVPGDVVQERLIGVDSATYQAGRHALELVPLADAVQNDLRRDIMLANGQLVDAKKELRRYQQDARADESEFQTVAAAGLKLAKQPLARPLLLDWHFYGGLGGGAVGIELVRVGVNASINW